MTPIEYAVFLKKRLLKNLAAWAWIAWGLYALSLLVPVGSEPAFAYFVYWLLCLTVLLKREQDLISPPVMFVLFSFLGFGLSIPIFTAGLIEEVQLPPHLMANVIWVLVVSVVGFLLGTKIVGSKLNKSLYYPLRASQIPRPAHLGQFPLVAGIVVAAGAIRIIFHLGEAGALPTFAFAGYAQFVLYQGVILLSLWFLAQGLQKGKMFILPGLSLLAALALTQALLSWRGAIFQMAIMALSIFWMQKPQGERKPASLAWVMVLGMFAGTIVQMGNEVRVARLGGEANFSKGEGGGIGHVLTRSQGTTRLAVAINHFGELSLTNNWFIFELLEKDISSTAYIDRAEYHVHEGQIHSVGASGPGGLYIPLGLSGVLLGYALLGILFQFAYSSAQGTSGRAIAQAAYACMLIMLGDSVAENFNLITVKALFAIFFQAYCFDRFLFRSVGERGPSKIVQDNKPLKNNKLFDIV